VHLGLDFPIGMLQLLALKREAWLQAEELEVIFQTLNDSPQPQRSFSFGLLNLKPSFRPSRA